MPKKKISRNSISFLSECYFTGIFIKSKHVQPTNHLYIGFILFIPNVWYNSQIMPRGVYHCDITAFIFFYDNIETT